MKSKDLSFGDYYGFQQYLILVLFSPSCTGNLLSIPITFAQYCITDFFTYILCMGRASLYFLIDFFHYN